MSLQTHDPSLCFALPEMDEMLNWSPPNMSNASDGESLHQREQTDAPTSFGTVECTIGTTASTERTCLIRGGMEGAPGAAMLLEECIQKSLEDQVCTITGGMDGTSGAAVLAEAHIQKNLEEQAQKILPNMQMASDENFLVGNRGEIRAVLKDGEIIAGDGKVGSFE